MNTPYVVRPGPRVRSRLDQTSATLLRSVMAENWRPEKVVSELLATVRGDRRVLAPKLSKATWERPTRITERAILALDHALAATADQVGPAALAIPLQGVRHA